MNTQRCMTPRFVRSLCARLPHLGWKQHTEVQRYVSCTSGPLHLLHMLMENAIGDLLRAVLAAIINVFTIMSSLSNVIF